jgi:hypothetical protein
MRSDLIPLCDKHENRMELMHVVDLDVTFYKCVRSSCHRCYSETRGYFTFYFGPKGGRVLEVSSDPRCPDHERPMFVSNILDTGKHVYSCPVDRCGRITGLEIAC